MSGEFSKDVSFGFFNTEENEFEEFLKRIVAEQKRINADAREGDLRFKYRFLSGNYYRRVFDRKYIQQVVIKKINSGSGINHLRTLIKYITRQSEKSEENIELYDENGLVISSSDMNKKILEWVKDFKSNEFEIDKEIKNHINAFEMISSNLNSKFYEGSLDKEGQDLYFYSEKLKDLKKASGKLSKGVFVYDSHNGEYGFLTERVDNKYSKGFFFDRELNYKERTIETDHIKNVGKEVKDNYFKQPKDFSHFIYSVGGDDPDVEKTTQATLETLRKNFEDKGYEYVIAKHEDTKNLHYHVIVNHNSKIDKVPRLNLGKFDLSALRINYANTLDKYGVNREAVMEYDRANYLESLKKKVSRMQYKGNWFNYKLQQSDNQDFDALKFRKAALSQIDGMIDKMKNVGLHNEVKILKEERKKYTNMEVSDFAKAIKYTENLLVRDGGLIYDSLKGKEDKTRETAVRDLDKIIKLYKEWGKDEDKIAILQDEKYRYKNLVDDNNLEFEAEYTAKKIGEVNKNLGKMFLDHVVENMGAPDDYKIENENYFQAIENYQEHLSNTIEDLEAIPDKELTNRLMLRRVASVRELKCLQRLVEHAISFSQDKVERKLEKERVKELTDTDE